MSLSFAKRFMEKKQKGFTLIELLLVIAIIAILATVVIVALDPATRFKNTRDARRLSDLQSILTAVRQYVVDNKGSLPPGLDTTERQLGTVGNCDITSNNCSVSGGTDCLDLSVALEKYLKNMPYDPSNGATSERTRYSIQADNNGIVTVRSCDSEDAAISSISR